MKKLLSISIFFVSLAIISSCKDDKKKEKKKPSPAAKAPEVVDNTPPAQRPCEQNGTCNVQPTLTYKILTNGNSGQTAAPANQLLMPIGQRYQVTFQVTGQNGLNPRIALSVPPVADDGVRLSQMQNSTIVGVEGYSETERSGTITVYAIDVDKCLRLGFDGGACSRVQSNVSPAQLVETINVPFNFTRNVSSFVGNENLGCAAIRSGFNAADKFFQTDSIWSTIANTAFNAGLETLSNKNECEPSQGFQP